MENRILQTQWKTGYYRDIGRPDNGRDNGRHHITEIMEDGIFAEITEARILKR